MGCTFRARLNALSSIWYTILVLAVQSYLLYLGFERYKLYTDMKWPTGGYPSIWLTIYVSLYAACIPMSLVLFAFGVFKSGNIAGDNERLSDREERVIEVSRNRNGDKRGCLHRLKSLWQHSPPLPQQLHLLMALCQVVAQQLMIAQLYRHGFINSGDFLNTELDFVYQRARQLATNLPMGDTRLQGFRITADELSGSPLAPNLLPLLMHVRLFGIPLEFVNLFVSLLAYSIAWPAVFWRVSKPFGLVFTTHMFIFSATLIWNYLGFSVLFRIQETNFNSVRPVGLGQYLLHSRQLPFYHPYAIAGTFAASTALMLLAPMALYAYGYNKYYVNLLSAQQQHSSRGGSQDRKYSRSPTERLCCDGYGPHTFAILLLVLIVVVKAPTIYALMILYQHEEKPLLLSCIVLDVVYLFTWIILWLALTLKRDWRMHVVHRTHHIYALQKGMAGGHIRGNENPSQLKNALIVMHKDHMFVTDDGTAKQSLLRHIQRGQFDQPDENWLRHGAHHSPTMRKIPMDEAKGTPEMSRLMQQRRPSEEQQVAYHTVNRGGVSAANNVSVAYRGNSSPPDERNTFGTMGRGQSGSYMAGSSMQRGQSGTLQRAGNAGQWPTQQEAYASIHKQSGERPFARRGSQDEPAYGTTGAQTYGSAYGTYARLPPSSRIAVPPGAPIPSAARISSMQQSTLGRRPSDGPSGSAAPSSLAPSIGVRQSPLLGERAQVAVSREQSPYQRSTVKLSSFNQDKAGYGGVGQYGTVNQWATQRAPPGQPQQLLWSNGQQKAASLSTSSSAQDAQCFTPTSTLTSQGSASNCSSQPTPTPGSPGGAFPRPPASLTHGLTQGIYGNADDYSGTLQKRQAGGTLKKRADDSANFSLSSSNGSAETRTLTDYATSIV